MAERTTRVGRMKSEHTPARSRSDARRFGARCMGAIQDQELVLDEEPTRRFTERAPPGPISRAVVVDQVNQQDEHAVAHRNILPTSPKITRRDISPYRGAD